MAKWEHVGRYHKKPQNRAIGNDNPYEKVIIPSEELEQQNARWEISMSIIFSPEEMETFKRVRSYEMFRDYCSANDMVVLI